MTDREKLIEILAKYFTIGDSYEYSLTRVKEAFAIGTMTMDDFVEFDDDKVADIADHLLSHGVTVKEPQKPLTVEELFEIAHKCDEGDRTVWMEDSTGWADGVVLHACSILYDSDEEEFVHYMFGDSNDFLTDPAYYGKTWRCWAEKPTEAERKNAKWEE